jgi:protease-4
MDNTTSLPPGAAPPPPPPIAPPPVIQPPPAQRRKRSGWKILLVVLAVLVVIGFGVAALGLLGSITRLPTPYAQKSVGPRIEEIVVEDSSASAKIAVLELRGIITSEIIDPGGFSLADVIKAQLKRAEEDARVKAVILKIDSPGGEVLASDEINKAVTEFQSKTGKPVVASLGSLAASGGYYVAVGSRWIVANELTLTGSIGVILSSWNYRGLMDKVGVRPFTYKSGKFKDMLSGSRDPGDIPAEERAMVQGLVDEVYRQFKSVVAEGRESAARRNKQAGQKLVDDWETYADGRVLSGSEAFQHGFVDELGNFSVAVARARKLADLPDAKIVRYQRRVDFADLFRFFGETEGRSMTLDLGVDLPKLNTGQLYFLPLTHLP